MATAAPSFGQIALDVRNKAVGDPAAVAFNSAGDVLAVAAAGTQELLLFQAGAISWVGGEPGDFLDTQLQDDDAKFRRVPLGGRPLAVQFVKDTAQAVVANHLDGRRNHTYLLLTLMIFELGQREFADGAGRSTPAADLQLAG